MGICTIATATNYNDEMFRLFSGGKWSKEIKYVVKNEGKFAQNSVPAQLPLVCISIYLLYWQPFKLILMTFKLALLYNFTSVYTNIPSCRRDQFPPTRGNICVFTSTCTIKFLYLDQ